jgi:gliding motility-associated-like protein
MNRLSNYYRSLLLFLVTAFFSAGAYAQSCQIAQTSPSTMCVNDFFSASATTDPAKTVTSITWNYGDGNGGSGTTVSHKYTVRGPYTITMHVVYSDGSTCDAPSVDVKVNGKPHADFELKQGIPSLQCYQTNGIPNEFCFIDKSTRSADGAKIQRWSWNFGDGDTSGTQNPCHSYDSSGIYTIVLEIFDENGCSDLYATVTSITVLPDIKTNFTTKTNPGCKETEYQFNNKTDTNGVRVKRWYWDFGDGSPIDSVNWNPKHKYTGDSMYNVTLTIVNALGCKVSNYGSAQNIIAELHVTYKDSVCWSDAKKGHSFFAEPINGAGFYNWNFGDPDSGPLNNAPYVWTGTHNFVGGPKNYQVTFSATHPICGKFDTCIVFHVKGPLAKIVQPDPLPPILSATNSYVPAKPMPTADFIAINNTASNCANTTIKYSVFTKLSTPKRNVRYKYCNSDINTKYLDTAKYCDGDKQIYSPSIDLKPIDSVVTYIDSVENGPLTWTKGQAIPKNPYYPSSGQWMPTNIHDSNLFTCVVPNLVHFSNHSLKYRLYKALDDNTTAYVNWDTPEPDYPKIIFENGWKDTCINKGYPYASDSMTYLWEFQDPNAKPCTSSVSNKDWECNFSTLIAPYHYYTSQVAPRTRCQAVKLTVTDAKMGCSDFETLQLKQGPPQAWWDRSSNGYCKMTWEMQQFMTDKGEAGNPDKPLRGFIMDWQNNCTGYGEFFRLNFTETLPSCGAQDYWLVFDSAAATKVVCTDKVTKYQYKDYGFLGANNAKGYPVGGPKKVWSAPPWLNRYWYMDGDEGCKTVGVVLKNGACYDTAWYHDYICFNRLTAEFNILKVNPTVVKAPNGKPLDTTYTYTLMDSSLSLTSQGSGRIFCHSFGAASKPGFNIALLPNDRKMPGVTDFLFQIRRQEFPAGDFYYYKNNPGSVIKGFWPDTAMLNPYEVKHRKTDNSPIDPNYSVVTDSISSIYDTVYVPMDSTVYTYQYDPNGKIVDSVFISGIQLRTGEVDNINTKGVALLPTNDFRSRYLSLYCKTAQFPVKSITKKVLIKDTIYLLKLIDPRLDDRTFIMDPKTGKPTVDSMPIKDTVNFRLPFPGFYTIASASRNLDGCVQSSLYHLIYGHFARFNIQGGDSIICVGDTIRLDYMIRYWTTNCPPLPGGPPPAGCIDGTIANYTGILKAWDTNDPEALRQSLDSKWKKTASYRNEVFTVYWGDGAAYGGTTATNGTTPWHVYNKPGIYDITLRSTDSNGCTINTIRHNFIKVVGLDAKFVVSPEVDTSTVCRKFVTFKDKTELIGTELKEPGKFGYKEQVVRRDPFTGQFYLDTTKFVVDSIIVWTWDRGDGTPPVPKTGTDSLVMFYLKYGRYSPGLRVFTANTTPHQCSDEQIRNNYLRLVGPVPNFTIDDTAGCQPFTLNVNVINDSADTYEWVLEGEGTTYSSQKGEKKVKLTYDKPGRYRLVVRQTETHYDPTIGTNRKCDDEWPAPEDSLQFYVTIYPNGPINLTGDTVVCKGEKTNFLTKSTQHEYTKFEYDYGDGSAPVTGADSASSTTYADTGFYWVRVLATTDHGCVMRDSLRVYVEGVDAIIGVDSTKANLGMFTFSNKSIKGKTYTWNFGDGSPEVNTTDMNPIPHTYTSFSGDVPEGDGGAIKPFVVKLTTISENGCPDVDSVSIIIPRKWKRYNVFTPNGDGLNDKFNPAIGGETSYELKIYNRWGEQVFESSDSQQDWNGKVNNSGGQCPAGTYYYVWKFKLVGGFEKSLQGTVTLLR